MKEIFGDEIDVTDTAKRKRAARRRNGCMDNLIDGSFMGLVLAVCLLMVLGAAFFAYKNLYFALMKKVYPDYWITSMCQRFCMFQQKPNKTELSAERLPRFNWDHWDGNETTEILLRLLKLYWDSVQDSTEILLRLYWDSTEITETLLRFYWDSTETPHRVHWDSTETLLRLYIDST